MRIAFAGTPDVALPSLRHLLEAGHEVVAVITRPDAPAGRGRNLAPSPVAQFALERSLPVLKPQHLAEISDTVRQLAPECIAVVAYGALVPAEMLDIPRHGWINLHFSLLPAWRGAAPVQRAVMAGDDLTGACTFRLEAGLDTGPLFGSVTRRIAPDDTAGSLLAALAEDGAQLLAETVAHLDALVPQPQPTDGVSVAPKLTKEEARVRWSQPAHIIDRRIRGCTPDPGAWSEASEHRLVLGPIRMRADVDDLTVGAIRLVDHDLLVGTGTHAVALGQVKPAGKGWMEADAWWRGLREEAVFTDAG